MILFWKECLSESKWEMIYSADSFLNWMKVKFSRRFTSLHAAIVF